MKTVALVGNPNCGKSTLFNVLTGIHQHVGNWPGVTVEKKFGTVSIDSVVHDVVDLPGLFSLEEQDGSLGEDELIVRNYLGADEADLVVNVIDATSLARGLYLTMQLLALAKPTIVVLNMMDTARALKLGINVELLAKELGCTVVPISASKRQGLELLRTTIATELEGRVDTTTATRTRLSRLHSFNQIDGLVKRTVRHTGSHRTISTVVDDIVLNRYLAFPIFLGVLYLMFFFTINIGSAFIDLFDIAGAALFVDGPRIVFEAVGLPGWLVAFLADGVGGGVQLVATFIPVIGCLFLFLSCLEDSGYIARIAFILDRLMVRVGLPGKAIVPLLVGFGCNVPAVMATRNLDSKPDRILTTIMAPFMSCGARLAVYALFATAFFPSQGQNIVFLLYVLGVIVAVGSAWIVRKYILLSSTASFTLVLPSYHMPTFRGVCTHTWHRLKGFITRAGKAIVAVVIVLNILSSFGTDGSFGNENTEKSALAVIGKSITPFFHPMGIEDKNWPATVGIFTGMFAKEVVVGTLDALYSPTSTSEGEFDLSDQLLTAVQTVPANFADLTNSLLDPLGMRIESIDDVTIAAAEHAVEINTVTAMQTLFNGDLGAFAYLVFILLYMPCVATIGVIYKEIGGFWAVFTTAWSVVMAYVVAVVVYQVGLLTVQPIQSLIWLASVITVSALLFYALVYWGRQTVARSANLIPARQIT